MITRKRMTAHKLGKYEATSFAFDLHALRFFDEVELVVDLNLIQRKGECFVRLTLLQILKSKLDGFWVDETVRFKLMVITKALTLRGLARSFLLRASAATLASPGKFALRIGNDKIVFKSDNYTSNIIKKVYELGLKLRRNQEVDDLGLTIEKGEVINEPMVDIVKTRHDDEMIEGIDEYPIVENMDVYQDKDMGEVIVGKPFCREVCVKARRFEG
ncbi:hypothetical protein Tco_0003969, partial [Tanacetum coccineum]